MKSSSLVRWCLIAGLLACSINFAGAENWPAWRGPRGDGSSLEKNLPTRWSASENILWKTPIPGAGYSSPVIWGDRIFLTTALEPTQERVLLCLDRKTGKILWNTTVLRSPLEKKNPENGFASATPATDGKNVFTAFLDGKEVVISAHDFNGQQVWQKRPGTYYSVHGFCSTPILFEDKVIVDLDSKADNFIVALRRADGGEAWRIKRDDPTQSYSPPLIRQMAGRVQMIVAGNKAVTSYDPADGKFLWKVDGPSEDCVASPVYDEKSGLVLSASSWPKRILYAIKPDGTGNVTRTHLVWQTPEGAPYVPLAAGPGRLFPDRRQFQGNLLLQCRHGQNPLAPAARQNLCLAGFRRRPDLFPQSRRGDDRGQVRPEIRTGGPQRARREDQRLPGDQRWPDLSARRQASLLHRISGPINQICEGLGKIGLIECFVPFVSWRPFVSKK